MAAELFAGCVAGVGLGNCKWCLAAETEATKEHVLGIRAFRTDVCWLLLRSSCLEGLLHIRKLHSSNCIPWNMENGSNVQSVRGKEGRNRYPGEYLCVCLVPRATCSQHLFTHDLQYYLQGTEGGKRCFCGVFVYFVLMEWFVKKSQSASLESATLFGHQTGDRSSSSGAKSGTPWRWPPPRIRFHRSLQGFACPFRQWTRAGGR